LFVDTSSILYLWRAYVTSSVTTKLLHGKMVLDCIVIYRLYASVESLHVRHPERTLSPLLTLPPTIQFNSICRPVPLEKFPRCPPFHKLHQCMIAQPRFVPSSTTRNLLFVRILYKDIDYTQMLANLVAYSSQAARIPVFAGSANNCASWALSWTAPSMI
jgi:hypothetical protein